MSDFDGLLFDDLSEFKKDLLRSVNQAFPEATNEFLKDEAKKLRKAVKKEAKHSVGTSKGKKLNWDKQKSYHNKFKIGKIYVYSENDKCVRVYNSAFHSHLIEQGHVQVPRGKSGLRAKAGSGRKLDRWNAVDGEQPRSGKSNKGGNGNGFTEGKFVMLMSQIAFKTQFETDVNEFLYRFVDDTCNRK